MTKVIRSIRKIVFWLHLIAGISAGLVILLLAVTGILLSFERQILEWVDLPKVKAPENANAQRHSTETLIQKAIAENPGLAFSSVNLRSEDHISVGISFGRDKTVYYNPYTGESLGEGSPKIHDAFHWITELHRWLALSDASRDTGKLVTGIACLIFLFLILSGLYLWWPGRWTWHFLKRIIWFDKRLTKRAKNWNWHNVFGFWCCVPLFFIVITGLIMSFSWANHLLYTFTGSEPPPERQRRRGGPPREEVVQSPNVAGLDAALVKVIEKMPQWRSISARIPTEPNMPASFLISDSHRGRPDRRLQVDVDLTTGGEKKIEGFESYNLGRKLRLWTRWVHTGEAGGFVGQFIAAFAAFGAVILVWTGFALSWQRFRRKKVKP